MQHRHRVRSPARRPGLTFGTTGKLRNSDLVMYDRTTEAWWLGQASALDAGEIADGRDVGNVLVEQRTANGWQDAVHAVDFAFAFHAFYPDSEIVLD